jgi:hypothetical protein
MTTRSLMLALFALALFATASPVQARYYYGWHGHHYRFHHRWHGGYARATSDYYHRSRQLVGTR